MKVTKDYLKKIIKEEIEKIQEGLADKAVYVVVSIEGKKAVFRVDIMRDGRIINFDSDVMINGQYAIDLISLPKYENVKQELFQKARNEIGVKL
jgi:alpha-D-ribose 1-methylphosphonate 5-phosphate C-P lyase